MLQYEAEPSIFVWKILYFTPYVRWEYTGQVSDQISGDLAQFVPKALSSAAWLYLEEKQEQIKICDKLQEKGKKYSWMTSVTQNL